MRREEFSFSQFERAQAEAQAAIEKATRDRAASAGTKPTTFAEQATPSAREEFAISPEVLKAAGIETDDQARERVAKARQGQAGTLRDFTISERVLDNALDQPKELEGGSPAVTPLGLHDPMLHNPNQYGSGHSIAPKRELPPTPLATQSAQEVFGISEHELVGRGTGVGVEDPRKYGMRAAVAPAQERQSEEAKVRILGKLLPPVRGPIAQGESVPVTEAKRRKDEAEQSITYIQQEMGRIERQLASKEDEVSRFRETVKNIQDPTLRSQVLKQLGQLIQQRDLLQNQRKILEAALKKRLPEFQGLVEQ